MGQIRGLSTKKKTIRMWCHGIDDDGESRPALRGHRQTGRSCQWCHRAHLRRAIMQPYDPKTGQKMNRGYQAKRWDVRAFQESLIDLWS